MYLDSGGLALLNGSTFQFGADDEGEINYGELPAANEALELAQKDLEVLQKNGAILKEDVADEDIARVVSSWTGIPVSRLQEGERSKLVQMEERLSDRVVGQKKAITAVSNAVRRARAGLQDENRPIGSFLFLGPTGVGKTELSKALAEFLFDDDSHWQPPSPMDDKEKDPDFDFDEFVGSEGAVCSVDHAIG